MKEEELRLLDIIKLMIEPITTNKYLIIVSTFIVSVLGWIMSSVNMTLQWLSAILVIHVSFIIVYFILCFMDWGTGLFKVLIVKKGNFKGDRFIMKPLSVGFSIFIMYATVTLSITFQNYEHHDIGAIKAILSIVVTLIEASKIILMLAFIIYELSSLRNNFMKLGHKDAVRIIDYILVPIVRIRDYVSRKFDKTIEVDLDNKPEPEIQQQ